MKNDDRKEFSVLMKATFELYDREVTKTTGNIWWSVFEKTSIEDFRGAMNAHIKKSHFCPKPADIRELLNGRWMDADEAWGLFPKDEQDTGVANQAMLDAWQAALELYECGDTNGARMAFRSAYNRSVEARIANGEVELFTVSLGHDPDRRETGIKQAIARRLITSEQANKYLPYTPNHDYGPIAGLLTGKPVDETAGEKTVAKLHKLKELIDGKQKAG